MCRPRPQAYREPVLKNSDFTVANVVSSACGGVASALLLSRFGVTGSLLGAALGPVVFLVAKELTKHSTNRAVDALPRPLARRPDDEPREVGGVAPVVEGGDRASGGRRWRRRHTWMLATTAVVATVIAMAAITLPELIAGRSIVSDRRTTLFSSGDAQPSRPARPAAATTTAPTTTGGAAVAPPGVTSSTPAAPTPAPASTSPAPHSPAPHAAPAAPATTTPAAPDSVPAPTPAPTPPADPTSTTP